MGDYAYGHEMRAYMKRFKEDHHGIWPPLVTAVVFGLLGTYTIFFTGQFVGYGMWSVCLTSLVYHSSYTLATRVLDISCNCLLFWYFCIFDWRWYYLFAAPFLAGGWTFTLWLRKYTRARSPESVMMKHVFLVHLPAILGFLCIAVLQ